MCVSGQLGLGGIYAHVWDGRGCRLEHDARIGLGGGYELIWSRDLLCFCLYSKGDFGEDPWMGADVSFILLIIPINIRIVIVKYVSTRETDCVVHEPLIVRGDAEN